MIIIIALSMDFFDTGTLILSTILKDKVISDISQVYNKLFQYNVKVIRCIMASIF